MSRLRRYKLLRCADRVLQRDAPTKILKTGSSAAISIQKQEFYWHICKSEVLQTSFTTLQIVFAALNVQFTGQSASFANQLASPASRSVFPQSCKQRGQGCGCRPQGCGDCSQVCRRRPPAGKSFPQACKLCPQVVANFVRNRNKQTQGGVVTSALIRQQVLAEKIEPQPKARRWPAMIHRV
jgi:hypothetical protein